MKAGIIIDDYKLSAFKKALEAEGFKYEERKGPVEGTLILAVEFEEDTKEKLVKLTKAVNSQHSREVN